MDSNDWIQQQFDASRDAYAVVNLDSRQTVHVNATFSQLVLISKKDLIGQSFPSLCTSACRSDLLEAFRQVSLRGTFRDLELTLQCGGGMTVNVNVDLSSARDESSRRKHCLMTMREQSEGLKIEQLITTTTSMGIFATDDQGRCIYANPASARFLGYASSHQLMGHLMDQLVHHSDQLGNPLEPEDCPVEQVFQTRYPVHSDDSVFWRKDGTRFFVEYWAKPLYADGRWFGTMVTFVDNSLRTMVENEREQVKKILEGRVEDRARQLRRSVEDLSQFAYAASHDMREPLRAIVGYAELLKDELGEDNVDAIDFVNRIVSGGERMSVLLDGLLEFSRVDRKGSAFQEFPMKDVLEGVLFDLSAMVEEHKAVIVFQDLPEIVADRLQIDRLFQNLIANSIKYNRSETPTIKIHGYENADSWIFSVTDNGIGIEEEFHDKIFGLFSRLHTRDEYPGTGIGLALCQRIVERHDGSIHVRSKDGNGTTFVISLPRRTLAADAGTTP